MSKPEFTSGPWKVDFGHPRGLPGGISQKGAPHKPVTRFNSFARPSTREALANAHLIAAAPEMYEALEAIWNSLDASMEEQSHALQMVATAIAKAEGRS